MKKLLLFIWMGLLLSGVSAAAIAATEGGTVWTWPGRSVNGIVIPISAVTNAVAIAPRFAVKTDGTLWALWHGETTQVSGMSDIVAIVGQWPTSLALKADGTVWKFQNVDQFFNVTMAQVDGLSNVITIAANIGSGGEAPHGLAVEANGTVWEWAEWYWSSYPTPVQVDGLSNVVAVAAGDYHSLALKTDGTVWAWGQNFSGQLGNGIIDNDTHPVQQVAGLDSVIAVAAGEYHSMALKADGTVWAWGANGSGQLGNGTTAAQPTPVQVGSLTGVTVISGGLSHSLAVKADGTIWAWGGNYYGELGDCTTVDRYTPVQVVGLSEVTAIAAGYVSSVAIGNYAPGYCAPTARSYDRTVNEGDLVTLSTEVADDGVISSYAWTQTAGPAVTLSNAAAITPTFTAPQVNADTGLSFQLTVADSLGLTGSAVINVTVKNVNGPDLIVSAISGAASVKRGSAFAFSSTTKNQGNTATTASTNTGLYLSTDAQITTSDILLGSTPIASLAAGASSKLAKPRVTVPGTLAPGTYYLGAIADYTGVEGELNESNNSISGATIVVQ